MSDYYFPRTRQELQALRDNYNTFAEIPDALKTDIYERFCLEISHDDYRKYFINHYTSQLYAAALICEADEDSEKSRDRLVSFAKELLANFKENADEPLENIFQWIKKPLIEQIRIKSDAANKRLQRGAI